MKAEHREAGPVGIKNMMREKGLKGTRETGSKEIRGGLSVACSAFCF